jgi:hypothetical protein
VLQEVALTHPGLKLAAADVDVGRSILHPKQTTPVRIVQGSTVVLALAIACCCLMVLFVLLLLLLLLLLELRSLLVLLLLSLPNPPPATSHTHFPPAASYSCSFTAAVAAEGPSSRALGLTLPSGRGGRVVWLRTRPYVVGYLSSSSFIRDSLPTPLGPHMTSAFCRTPCVLGDVMGSGLAAEPVGDNGADCSCPMLLSLLSVCLIASSSRLLLRPASS